jgi:hypothetical protein
VQEGSPDGRDVAIPDADPSCQCLDASTISCSGGSATCALGCVAESPGAHCAVIDPSNGVPVDLTDVSGAVVISGVATFDTDTGEISGAVTRSPGEGTIGGIRFVRMTASTPALGVFTFADLVVTASGTVRFAGSAAAVFVATSATIDGTIDASGGCYGADRTCPGPGGGGGALLDLPAGGCAAGAAGESDPDPATGADGGGGGGGGGGVGGSGGSAGSFAGGDGGGACMAPTLEPLVGGSGGGGAGPGAAPPPRGGGGGGALQISALDRIAVGGTIVMAGAGGAGGPGAGGNAAGGSGGGAGGGILLEAPVLVLANGSVLAATGGGGGGGGAPTTPGPPGQDGQANATPAAGGVPAPFAASRGGRGGAGTTAAETAANVGSAGNAGGGGGAAGRIYLRSAQAMTDGIVSPPAGTGPVRSQ